MTEEQQFRYDLTKLAMENGVPWRILPFVVNFLREWILDGRDTLPQRTPDTAQTKNPDPEASACPHSAQ